MEIVPEKEIIQATQEGKRLFYEKFVNLEDNITINYLQEKKIERERERINILNDFSGLW
jgi:hypothetical protein